MALHPGNVDEARHMLKEQLEAYIRFRALFRKAFGKPRPLDHREEEFTRTKEQLKRLNRLLKALLPRDLSHHVKSVDEQITFMSSLRSMQEYSEFQREDVIKQWHETYLQMTRSYGALRTVSQGYWPQLHRELLYEDKSRFKKARRQKRKDRIAGIFSGSDSKEESQTTSRIKQVASIAAIPVVLLIIVAATIYGPDNSPKGQAKKMAKEMQKTPEGAVKFFLQAAYDFQARGTFGESYKVQMAVTEGDWEWFMSNYESLAVDPHNVTSAIDPMLAEAMKKVTAMQRVLGSGPNHPQDKILKIDVNGNRAKALIEKHQIGGPGYEMELDLVQEGRAWKVTNIGKHLHESPLVMNVPPSLRRAAA